MNEEQLLYFCVPNKKGYLLQLELPFCTFSDKSMFMQNGREAALEALKFRNPLAYLGKDYQELCLVCTPACDIGIHYEAKHSSNCYVKTSDKTATECYLSGHRSAILIQEGRALRLKGCGNDFNGFEYIKGTGLRGCHFYHTSKREMYMTSLINREL